MKHTKKIWEMDRKAEKIKAKSREQIRKEKLLPE